MLSYKGKTTIKGRIVEIRGGEKRISRSYTYGYMSLTVRVGTEMYSVLVNSSKINTYGFLPEHFPNAHNIGERTISLPFYPKLREPELCYVVDSIRQIMENDI